MKNHGHSMMKKGISQVLLNGGVQKDFSNKYIINISGVIKQHLQNGLKQNQNVSDHFLTSPFSIKQHTTTVFITKEMNAEKQQQNGNPKCAKSKQPD